MLWALSLSCSLCLTHLMNLYVRDVVNFLSMGIFNFSSSVHVECVVMGGTVALCVVMGGTVALNPPKKNTLIIIIIIIIIIITYLLNGAESFLSS